MATRAAAPAESAKHLVMSAVMAAGLCGVALGLAGDHSLLHTALVAVFLIFGPSLAVMRFLPDMDPLARRMIALATTVVLLMGVSSIMLAAGLWSQTGVALVVGALTVFFLVASAERNRRGFGRQLRSVILRLQRSEFHFSPYGVLVSERPAPPRGPPPGPPLDGDSAANPAD